MEKDDLIQHLEQETQVFKNTAIKDAFLAIDRKDFVEPDYEVEAYEDYALPMIDGQTFTKPTALGYMLELLDPKKGHTVLNIGSGSGYLAALLAHMVGEDGKVLALEINPAILELSKKYLSKYKDLPIELVQADKDTGYYRGAPYDRIVSGVAFPNKETAMELMIQLVHGGIMVIPIGDKLIQFERVSDDDFYETEFEGFLFDDYIGKGADKPEGDDEDMDQDDNQDDDSDDGQNDKITDEY
ncbi:MAG: protein-L-isoaspartate O-methyltransferase [Patescibacteria group bacterium]